MREITIPPVRGILVMLGVWIIAMSATVAHLHATEDAGGEAVGAKVIEIRGTVEIGAAGEAVRAAKPGDFIYEGEDLTVYKGGAATLAMYDKTLREFTGPTTVTIRQDPVDGGTVLGNLTVAVADMLFSSNPQTSQAVMATRSIDMGSDEISLPVLTRPAPGENLLTMPRQFRWRGIRGVPLYRVTVYNATEMMWQTTTSEARTRWPVKDCDFGPGQTYYWVVEALVGNTILRSRAGEFTLLDKEGGRELAKALSEADASVSDPAVSLALRARLCLDSQAYSRAMEMLDESIEAAPSPEAYALRAEVNDALGHTEEAISDYRKAMSLTATDWH